MPVPIKKSWQIQAAIPSDGEETLDGYSPVMQQMLYNRGIKDTEAADWYLRGAGSMYDPYLLPDMEAAVDRIWYALEHQEPMAVYGDYDVDGVTATALLVQVLKRLGGNVIRYIPNRFDEGYGVNNDALDMLHDQGIGLVVTVDCGIRSPREADHARQMGMDLVISDHHEPKADLPEALAVICQKRSTNTYPERNLAGVGLAFKIVEAMLAKRPVEGVNSEDWLDLVAIGTVADVVPLTGENRSLVRAGLKNIRFGQRQGLLSLVNVAGLSIQKISARDIGYGLGPRLNAAGRLESALAAFDLLVATDLPTSGLLAQKLDDQNRDRQRMTQQMQVEAEKLACASENDSLLIAVDAGFNMGVVGLVAARLTDAYYRPAIVGSRGEEFTRASCRSIPEFNITHALDECTPLLERHGGHAMAAGFTVRNENFEELSGCLHAIARRELGERDLRPVLLADMQIPLRDLRPNLLKDLDMLEPTGLGNPEAVFVSRDLRVKWPKKIGNEGQHLRMSVTDGYITYDAVAFRQGHWADQMPARVDLLYVFETNLYQGRESLQLNVRDIRPAENV
jgi:single-stranded-DNA-specific exonuclease